MISFKISVAIVACFSDKCVGKLANHTDNSEMSICTKSPMFFSFILKYKDSFLKREPSHSGQMFSSINSFAHLLIEEEPLSSY